MEELPAELRDFLRSQPFLQLTEDKKIKCTLNGHEFPCNLAELQKFTSGNKFKKLCAGSEFNYSQYEPHLVPSTKEPNRLFCKLTLRHINRVPHHVLRHVNGKRFKKAVAQYEECVKQGVKFVPARLRQRKQPKDTDDGVESSNERRKQKQKQDSGVWAPSSSGEEDGDTDDSMSDLYPPSMFTLKKSEEQEGMEEDDDDDDDFQTDEDDMEVTEMEEEKQASEKRRKVQSASFSKKLKKNRKRKCFKPVCQVKNGK
ncbi:surfeit locus protein 2 [Pygocentrus nattereri]|uniref:Surfeit 2 n=1 Tax=Pygocentrus nattereri TaxID=42514 RepID=A0A3B4CAE5_PYGNA|nr:surfeit locus protein 2 [Pygocentrus nattereri]